MLHVVYFFVYGTLQRGQCRENCWPRAPLRVLRAEVQGALYHLVSYPALVPGYDRVAGELWEINATDEALTCEALDVVEGFANEDDDLYRRERITCLTDEGIREAWTYLYHKPLASGPHTRVLPDEDGLCRWKAERFT